MQNLTQSIEKASKKIESKSRGYTVITQASLIPL